MERGFDARVAVAEERLDGLEEEMLRARRRLDRLEVDRMLVRAVATNVGELSRRVAELTANIETIAKRAAEAAVRAVFDERARRSRDTWTVRAAWVAAGGTVGGVATAVGLHFL